MADDDIEILDHIPDEVPPFSVTSEGVHWPADGWQMSDFFTASVITAEEVIPFSEVTLEDTHIVNGTLTDKVTWEDLDMAISVVQPGAGLFLALSTITEDGTVETLMMPYGVFGAAFGAPPVLREIFSATLTDLVEKELIDVFDANMDWLFAAPAQPTRSAVLRPLTGVTAGNPDLVPKLPEMTL